MEFYTYFQTHGNKILYRGFLNGRRVLCEYDYNPKFYKVVDQSRSNTDKKSLYGRPLYEFEFDDISSGLRAFRENQDTTPYHGMGNVANQFITEKYRDEIKFDPKLFKIVTIDIETEVNNGFPDVNDPCDPILLISVHDKATGKLVVFGTRPLSKTPDYEYRLFNDEVTMLKEFIIFWQKDYPDILTGWNTEYFDTPYLYNRIKKVISESFAKRLSPFGVIKVREDRIDPEKKYVEIFGVAQLDYLRLYRKYTYGQQESYALGNIAEIELGDTKLENPHASFKEFYTKSWDLFVDYNAKDSSLVARLDDKMKLIELVMGICYLAKCNLEDNFSPVRVWDTFIYNHLYDKGVVVPPKKKKDGGEFVGAYVKEPTPGMYGFTMSFDFGSLYPTIIRQWNMSPETLVDERLDITDYSIVTSQGTPDWSEYAKSRNYTLAANGTMYRKDIVGFLPELMAIMLDGRKIAKKEMLRLEQIYQDTKDESLTPMISSLNNKQMAFKILANSAYGAISTTSFRYFDLRIAEAITMTGQASDKHVEFSLNKYMNSLLGGQSFDYVIAADTDSVYLNVQPLVDKFFSGKDIPFVVKALDKIGEDRLQKVIDGSIDHVFDVCNCKQRLMNMKREAIASKALWCKKKRYAMKVHNSEGVDYHPYKIKIMGLDLIKSSTPKVVRGKLKEALTMIFETDEKTVQTFIKEYRTEFKTHSPEAIAFPRSCNNLAKFKDSSNIYQPKTPIHVRAALLYNWHYGKSGEIRDGDKIKYVYLKVPNPILENVIAFTDKFPDQDLARYVDYTLLFEKTFLNPLQELLDSAGWKAESLTTLEDIFGPL